MKFLRGTIMVCGLLLALGACSEQREALREKWTGERFGDPVVGPRRSPMYNPGARLPASVPPAMTVAPKPAAPATPYDQYDAGGNDTSRRNYIKEWTSPAPKSTLPSSRKSFGAPAANTAPVAPAELPDDTVKTLKKRDGSTPPATKIVPAAPSEPEENGVFLPEKRAGLELRVTYLPVASLGPLEDEQVHLSSVPLKPEQFKRVRQEKKAAADELLMQHNAAMEQKKLLGEEPSDLVPAATAATDAAPAIDTSLAPQG